MDQIYKQLIQQVLNIRVDIPQIRDSIISDIEKKIDNYHTIKQLKSDKIDLANKLLQEQSKIDIEISRLCSHDVVSTVTDPVTAKSEKKCEICGEFIDA